MNDTPGEDQPSPPQDEGLNISVAAHDNGTISVSFDRPVAQLGFSVEHAMQFMLAINTALVEALKQKPKIQVPNGKPL